MSRETGVRLEDWSGLSQNAWAAADALDKALEEARKKWEKKHCGTLAEIGNEISEDKVFVKTGPRFYKTKDHLYFESGRWYSKDPKKVNLATPKACARVRHEEGLARNFCIKKNTAYYQRAKAYMQ